MLRAACCVLRAARRRAHSGAWSLRACRLHRRLTPLTPVPCPPRAFDTIAVRTAQVGLEHALAHCRTRLKLWLRNCLREAIDNREKKYDELVSKAGDWQLDPDMLSYRVREQVMSGVHDARKAAVKNKATGALDTHSRDHPMQGECHVFLFDLLLFPQVFYSFKLISFFGFSLQPSTPDASHAWRWAHLHRPPGLPRCGRCVVARVFAPLRHAPPPSPTACARAHLSRAHRRPFIPSPLRLFAMLQIESTPTIRRERGTGRIFAGADPRRAPRDGG